MLRVALELWATGSRIRGDALSGPSPNDRDRSELACWPPDAAVPRAAGTSKLKRAGKLCVIT